MSSRALRRLKGKQRGQEALDLGDLTLGDSSEEQLDSANVSPPPDGKDRGRKAKKNKAQKNFSNIYELVRRTCNSPNWQQFTYNVTLYK